VIGVNDRRGRRDSRARGHGQRVVHQYRLTPTIDRPAHDLARIDVQNTTAVDRALSRRVLGDVRQPQGVGPIGHEVSIHQVVVGGHVGEIVSDSFALGKTVDVEVAHDSLNELLVDDEPVLHPQSCRDAQAAVGAARVGVHLTDHVT